MPKWRSRVANIAAAMLAPPIATYISGQRDRLLPGSLPLPSAVRPRLLPYFPDEVLDRVRVYYADPLPIPDPPFAAFAERCGLPYPRPSQVAGITFDYLIATRVPGDMRVLFHELVHVVQYRILGVRAFSQQYVFGFLAHGGYNGIPLEADAYRLENEFIASDSAFSVEQIVREKLRREGR